MSLCAKTAPVLYILLHVCTAFLYTFRICQNPIHLFCSFSRTNAVFWSKKLAKLDDLFPAAGSSVGEVVEHRRCQTTLFEAGERFAEVANGSFRKDLGDVLTIVWRRQPLYCSKSRLQSGTGVITLTWSHASCNGGGCRRYRDTSHCDSNFSLQPNSDGLQPLCF